MQLLDSEVSKDIRYSVIITGKRLLGFSADEAAKGFAKQFKLSEDKSLSYIAKRRVLKQNLSVNKAHQYKSILESFGIEVDLVAKHNQPAATVGLTLVPIPGEPASDRVENMTSEIKCPKCQQTQDVGKFCTSCGASFVELGLIQENGLTNDYYRQDSLLTHENDFQDNNEVVHEKDFKPVMLITCSIAAALGSLIWLAMLILFDYETSLVALLIGAIIGYASTMTGSKGQITGIICAMFTLFAIFSGKYLAFETIQVVATNLSDISNAERSQLEKVYLEEKQIAQEYITLDPTQNALKRFMLKHQFSFARSINHISQQELQDFEIYSKPRLMRIATTAPTFDQWLSNTVSDIQGTSSFDLISRNFDIYDAMFLFLGVLTAFRIGRASA
ncbi:hypothetical protein FLL45_18710 [Aliikangiella marina]|uniref:Uncharacterized protein n=1 Tax=Aliikangiella marina TaxID=1712262 RepID=A0A545T4V2_9GAMM|nr:hypothetical protein [Aliikangiella marina]TQV72251.1 hypothetical protein FLL45_18710 [Aliikangiella marina]